MSQMPKKKSYKLLKELVNVIMNGHILFSAFLTDRLQNGFFLFNLSFSCV